MELVEFLVVDDADIAAGESFALVGVVRAGGVIGLQNAARVRVIEEHRHRIGVEKQAKAFFLALDFGDIDTQADRAAIGHLAFFDQDPAAIGQALFVWGLRIGQFGQTLGDPFFFSAGGFGVVAALHANAQRVSQARARLKEIGALGVDFGIALVPEDVAALRVEEHDAFRQGVHRRAQPIDRALGRGVRGVEGCLGGGPASLQA